MIKNFLVKHKLLDSLKKYKLPEANDKELNFILASNMQAMYFNDNEFVFKIDEIGDKLFIILKGKVILLKPIINKKLMNQKEFLEYLIDFRSKGEKFLIEITIRSNLDNMCFHSLEEFIIFDDYLFKMNLLEFLNGKYSNMKNYFSSDNILARKHHNIKTGISEEKLGLFLENSYYSIVNNSFANSYFINKDTLNALKLNSDGIFEFFNLAKKQPTQYGLNNKIIRFLDEDKDELYNYLVQNIVISNTEEDVYDKYKYMFIMDKELKMFTIYDYEIASELREGQVFGEYLLSSNEKKRTYSAQVYNKCVLGFISNKVYDKYIFQENDKLRQTDLSFLNSFPIFHCIKTYQFQKFFFNKFIAHEFYKGDILFKQNSKTENIFFIKEGKVEIYFSSSVLELQNFLEELINKGLEHDFFSIDEAHTLQNETLNQKTYQIKSEEFIKSMKKKREFLIVNISTNDIIGLEPIFFGMNNFYTAIIKSEKCQAFEIDKDNFLYILNYEPKCNDDYKNIAGKKLNSLIKRLYSVKTSFEDLFESENAYANKIQKIAVRKIKRRKFLIKHIAPINITFQNTSYQTIEKNHLIKNNHNQLSIFNDNKVKRRNNNQYSGLIKNKSLSKLIYTNNEQDTIQEQNYSLISKSFSNKKNKSFNRSLVQNTIDLQEDKFSNINSENIKFRTLNHNNDLSVEDQARKLNIYGNKNTNSFFKKELDDQIKKNSNEPFKSKIEKVLDRSSELFYKTYFNNKEFICLENKGLDYKISNYSDNIKKSKSLKILNDIYKINKSKVYLESIDNTNIEDNLILDHEKNAEKSFLSETQIKNLHTAIKFNFNKKEAQETIDLRNNNTEIIFETINNNKSKLEKATIINTKKGQNENEIIDNSLDANKIIKTVSNRKKSEKKKEYNLSQFQANVLTRILLKFRLKKAHLATRMSSNISGLKKILTLKKNKKNIFSNNEHKNNFNLINIQKLNIECEEEEEEEKVKNTENMRRENPIQKHDSIRIKSQVLVKKNYQSQKNVNIEEYNNIYYNNKSSNDFTKNYFNNHYDKEKEKVRSNQTLIKIDDYYSNKNSQRNTLNLFLTTSNKKNRSDDDVDSQENIEFTPNNFIFRKNLVKTKKPFYRDSSDNFNILTKTNDFRKKNTIYIEDYLNKYLRRKEKNVVSFSDNFNNSSNILTNRSIKEDINNKSTISNFMNINIPTINQSNKKDQYYSKHRQQSNIKNYILNKENKCDVGNINIQENLTSNVSISPNFMPQIISKNINNYNKNDACQDNYYNISDKSIASQVVSNKIGNKADINSSNIIIETSYMNKNINNINQSPILVSPVLDFKFDDKKKNTIMPPINLSNLKYTQDLSKSGPSKIFNHMFFGEITKKKLNDDIQTPILGKKGFPKPSQISNKINPNSANNLLELYTSYLNKNAKRNLFQNTITNKDDEKKKTRNKMLTDGINIQNYSKNAYSDPTNDNKLMQIKIKKSQLTRKNLDYLKKL